VPAEDPAEDADAGLREIGLGGLMRAVTQRNMRNLVCDDTRQLAFIARGVDHTAIDVHEAARKRESVDVRLVDDLEAVLKLWAAGVRRQPLADTIQVRIRLRVIEHRKLLLRSRRRLLTDADVVLRRDSSLVTGRTQCSDDAGFWKSKC